MGDRQGVIAVRQNNGNEHTWACLDLPERDFLLPKACLVQGRRTGAQARKMGPTAVY